MVVDLSGGEIRKIAVGCVRGSGRGQEGAALASHGLASLGGDLEGLAAVAEGSRGGDAS
jgi:hypothetical protein